MAVCSDSAAAFQQKPVKNKNNDQIQLKSWQSNALLWIIDSFKTFSFYYSQVFQAVIEAAMYI